jgi:Ni/Co efflux regulator RcnB
MKKFIALLISASVIAAPVAFADDQPAANQDAVMQQMSGSDQAASKPAPAAKKKAHCHHCNCAHKHKKAKKQAPAAAQ